MAKALLITTTDLKKYTVLDGNLDNDKFIQFIAIAQDIHLQNYLGTDLLEKIQSLLPTDIDLEGNANYKTLLNTFIKPMLVHWAAVEYLPFAAYNIANVGVVKHQSETSVTVDKNELDSLKESQRNIAQSYTKRFIDYVCDNSNLFPEYSSNSGSDVRPETESDFGGWVL
jgi:hypothetical protein